MGNSLPFAKGSFRPKKMVLWMNEQGGVPDGGKGGEIAINSLFFLYKSHDDKLKPWQLSLL
jgi:hypothetical protein